MQRRRTTLVGIFMLWLYGCTPGMVPQTAPRPAVGPWHDGTYTGIQALPTPQLLVVDVDILGRQIVAIRLRQHPEWQAPQAQELLLQRVIERQTTQVYMPRHDGSEHDLLLNAIEDALSKARRETQ